jgi:hypothetical protein
MNIHIHRLAALLPENSSYEGLDDDDVFRGGNQIPTHYGCGSGCRQYEELPIMLDGQPRVANAQIEYETQISGRYIRATRDSPEEYPDIEIWDPKVVEFGIYTHNGEEFEDEVCNWTPAGFQPGGITLDDKTLEDVLEQIITRFDADAQEVMEYEWEQQEYDDRY